jgi:NAD dependent epimerase/dehydratase family enzyme
LRIVIPGGTGYLGTLLARYFHSQNHSVTVISRFPAARPWEAVHWKPPELGEWVGALEGADALINLTSHRVDPAVLAKAVAQCVNPPRVFFTVGVDLRVAPVMSADPRSAFAGLRRLVRFALVGRAGSGRQCVSWIHDADFVRAVEFLIEQGQPEGPVDVCSRHPLPCDEFLAHLRNPLQLAFAYPNWLLEAAAFVLRADTQVILQDRQVQPSYLLQSGFEFEFPDWPEAARDLVSRRRG